MAHPSGTLFVPFPLQNSKSLILIHAARVGNNRHRVFVLLCTRCLKPCLHGVRLQPLAQPSSKRKEAQGENALCLHTEVLVSDKCRGRLERIENNTDLSFYGFNLQARRVAAKLLGVFAFDHRDSHFVYSFAHNIVFHVHGRRATRKSVEEQIETSVTDFQVAAPSAQHPIA